MDDMNRDTLRIKGGPNYVNWHIFSLLIAHICTLDKNGCHFCEHLLKGDIDHISTCPLDSNNIPIHKEKKKKNMGHLLTPWHSEEKLIW